MKIGEILKTGFTISFEFFPPKTEEGETDLFQQIQELKPLGPDFVTVTYGAGGSTRDRTRKLVLRMAGSEGLNVMAHLTCVGHTRAEVLEILETYQRNGIDDILALRGDPPAGSVLRPEAGELPHAIDLVRLIRERFGNYFSIGGASFPEKHPESIDMDTELVHFRNKVEAGLDFATSQFFFVNDYYYRYLERLAKMKIDIPVLPGIMPITNFRQIKRMAELSHAEFPSALLERLEKVSDRDDEVAKIGLEFAVGQCEDLLSHGVPGLHFYTMNHSTATTRIFESIRGRVRKA